MISSEAGDGYVMAKYAKMRDVDVTCVELYDEISGLAKRAREELINVRFVVSQDFEFGRISSSAVIIDAIFGIGLDRGIKELGYSIISKINELANLKVSIDMPTGLSSDNGEVLNFDKLKRRFRIKEVMGICF